MGQMSRQISKVIKVKTKEDPKFISTFFMAATHLFWTFGNVEKSILQTDNMLAKFQKRCRKLQLQITMLLALAEYRGGR